MTESKVFKLPEGIDASAVGKEVENFLRGTKNQLLKELKHQMVTLFKQKNKKDEAGKNLQVRPQQLKYK